MPNFAIADSEMLRVGTRSLTLMIQNGEVTITYAHMNIINKMRKK